MSVTARASISHGAAGKGLFDASKQETEEIGGCEREDAFIPKGYTSTDERELIRGIADVTVVPPKQVASVFDALTAVIGQDVARMGTFTLL